MNRNKFLKLISIGTVAMMSDISGIAKAFQNFENNGEKMPVLFIGHGSPLNAIENNDFTDALNLLGKHLPKPKAILCISAHWCTNGTFVNINEKPKMIYDMYGFPDELYKVNYPAPGSPQFAGELLSTIIQPELKPDTEWGFDHGNWSVMKHIYPDASIPLFQMSIDYNKPMNYHYELAKQLAFLREKGVLIVGSGNITHNLRQVDFSNRDAKPVDWALEFDTKVKTAIESHDHKSLIDYQSFGSSARLSVPEPSHYFPLIYTAALDTKQEEISYPYEKFHHGSLSMRCIKLG